VWRKEATKAGEFTTLISSDNKFYSITVLHDAGFTEFRDSLKKLPMTVAAVAKSFQLSASKGSIDYDEERPVDHVLSDDEKTYIRDDVRIIAEALWVVLQGGADKLTVGADSLDDFKRMLGKREFKRLFPVLPEDEDAFIRKSYRGGWCYVAKRFQREVVGPGSVYDVNSLYPSVMYDSPIPIGEPTRFVGEPDRSRVFVVEVTFTARLKPDHVPCIQIKRHPSFDATEYQEVVEEPTTVVLTSVDLELWSEQYDLDIWSFGEGFYFESNRDVFKPYIDKWSRVKKESTGGLRQLAKLHLNSLYGKFATNPDVTGRVPTLEDGRVRLLKGEEERRDPVYTATGSFITAYARAVTIRAAQANYEHFAYSDTDSLHLLTMNPAGIKVDDVELGCWKKEYEFDYGLFWRPKTYIERRMGGDGYEVHVAGLPRASAENLRFCDFADDAVLGTKLLPKTVSGGIVLSSVDFRLIK